MKKSVIIFGLSFFAFSSSCFAKGGVAGCGPVELKEKIEAADLELVRALHNGVGRQGDMPVCLRYAQGDVGTWLVLKSAASVLDGDLDIYHRAKMVDLSLKVRSNGKFAFCTLRMGSDSELALAPSSKDRSLCVQELASLQAQESKRMQIIQDVMRGIVAMTKETSKARQDLHAANTVKTSNLVGRLPSWITDYLRDPRPSEQILATLATNLGKQSSELGRIISYKDLILE